MELGEKSSLLRDQDQDLGAMRIVKVAYILINLGYRIREWAMTTITFKMLLFPSLGKASVI